MPPVRAIRSLPTVTNSFMHVQGNILLSIGSPVGLIVAADLFVVGACNLINMLRQNALLHLLQ